MEVSLLSVLATSKAKVLGQTWFQASTGDLRDTCVREDSARYAYKDYRYTTDMDKSNLYYQLPGSLSSLLPSFSTL